mgnify:CR=1 FL=1
MLTNNLVYIDQNGKELVVCSRADGLGFDVLKKLMKPVFILSTEKNSVVSARAAKLEVPVFYGIDNKLQMLKKLAQENNFDLNKIFYVGNDLNDYLAMKICGHTACPADSHPKIKNISNICLNSLGGKGVVREVLEQVLNINFIETLYD